MFANKGITVIFSTIIFTLSSSIAFAAEKSSASFAGWPILVLIAAIFIFRKKIFAETVVQEPETEKQVEPEKVKEKPAVSVAPTPEKTKTEKAATKPKAQSSSGDIDLTEDGKRCQAGTAKGSQCKRTNTLETASIKIDGATYQLTVCSQHNNDSLKPYSKLIKK